MIDLAGIRERIDALRELEACALRCAELGLIGEASGSAQDAPGEAPQYGQSTHPCRWGLAC